MKINPAQLKTLKLTASNAADDLQFITEHLVGELQSAHVSASIVLNAVQSAAQCHIWLAVSDKAHTDFGLELPEYAKAGGTQARRLVDVEAGKFADRLAKAA